ncbi:DUF4177 domain-containing protein [Tropicimonas sp. IMCC34011]|uniref:DUF4177 domain-containing protein n=1 Tax=Tropicimonas sp. IMCC34011 TaxID=2248759 RepID=UPI000E24A240
MPRYEYKVVPAPERGTKVKGLKTTPDRFAYALEELMNELGAKGWDYVRADTLPCEERSGLASRKTTYQNMLVFRRSAESATMSPAEGSGIVTAPSPQHSAVTAAPVASAPVQAAEAPVAAPEARGDDTAAAPVQAEPASDPHETPQDKKDAAAAAAAALSAYRGRDDGPSSAPPIGPAGPKKDQAAE